MNTLSLFNIQGLQPQTVQSSVPLVNDILKDKNQLFIVLTETWLYNHKEAELEIKGFKLFCCYRKRVKSKKGRSGGGVAIYIRNDIANQFKVDVEFSNGVNEVLLLYSQFSNTVLGALYRQPDDTTHDNPSGLPEFKTVLDQVRKLLNKVEGKFPDIFLCGDFNLPHMKWYDDQKIKNYSNKENSMHNELKNFMDEFQLHQCIRKPTHFQGNILDLFLTNNTDLIHSYTTIPCTLPISHHNLIEFTTHYNPLSTKISYHENRNFRNKFEMFNYFDEQVNWDNFNAEIDRINWPLEFNQCDPDKQLAKILNHLSTISESNVPKRKPINNSNRNYIIPNELRNLMRKRIKLIIKI